MGIWGDSQDLVKLVEDAMHLVMNGERAPGGDETWSEWYSRAEKTLRDNWS